MEKQGMDRRRKPLRAGLLIISGLILLCALPVRGALPQETGPEPIPGLEVQTSPRTPALRSPWTMTILVDHPLPAEVSVRPPPFPPALTLEQARTGLRVVQDRGGREHRLTAVEYVFIPRQAGTVTLAPFEIIVAGNRALTPEMSVRIPGPASNVRPRLHWAVPPPFLVIGEGAELRLVQDVPVALPPGYQPEAPENAILETLPLDEKDAEEGALLRLRIIPLSGTELIIPPFHFSSQGADVEIPSLRIPLRPSLAKGPAAVTVEHPQNDAVPPPPATSPERLPFPDIAGGQSPGCRFPLLRKGYEGLLKQVKTLWDEGQSAEALAEIRRSEGESAGGPGLRPLRREMEAALGLENTEDEPWRPQKLLFFLLPGDLALLFFLTGARIIWLRSCRGRKEGVTMFSSRCYTSIMGLLLAALVPVILILAGDALSREREGQGPAIVREDVPVYRIPEAEGTEEARIAGGRRVLIRAAAGSWVYLESPGGISGWVRREAVIRY